MRALRTAGPVAGRSDGVVAIPAAILTIFVGVNAYTAWGYRHPPTHQPNY